jgi:16S rRNA (guanine527-N7)-methyltransferase
MSSLAEYALDLFQLELSSEQIQQFDRLTSELIDWSQRMNLTAIKEPDDIMIKHHLDALTLVKVIPQFDGLRLIDVGTGAGYPGLALAITFPKLHVTFMDSTGKKLKYIDHVGETLNLKNITTLHSRAEDAGRDKYHRESYDIVTARAVARMPALMEYTLPLAKLEGQVIAMKGGTVYDETSSASNAISKLGGELFSIEEITLPTISDPRYLVIVDKIDPTPPYYPRNAGIPTREPIL